MYFIFYINIYIGRIMNLFISLSRQGFTRIKRIVISLSLSCIVPKSLSSCMK